VGAYPKATPCISTIVVSIACNRSKFAQLPNQISSVFSGFNCSRRRAHHCSRGCQSRSTPDIDKPSSHHSPRHSQAAGCHLRSSGAVLPLSLPLPLPLLPLLLMLPIVGSSLLQSMKTSSECRQSFSPQG